MDIEPIHKEADSAYGVRFPDLPGCFSAADAKTDILPNATEALNSWFENADTDEFVPATSRDDLAHRFADELQSGGAYLLPVPYDQRT